MKRDHANALISAIGGIWSFELLGIFEKAKLLLKKIISPVAKTKGFLSRMGSGLAGH